MEQQGGETRHSSMPAALQICPCAATAATHAGAVLGVLPFTNKASTEPCALLCLPPLLPGCCSHLAHPDSPGWITAESSPHPVSSVLHTQPNTGAKATAAEPGAAPGFILLCQGQAMQQHPRAGQSQAVLLVPRAATCARPSRADWGSQTDTHLLPAFQI